MGGVRGACLACRNCRSFDLDRCTRRCLHRGTTGSRRLLRPVTGGNGRAARVRRFGHETVLSRDWTSARRATVGGGVMSGNVEGVTGVPPGRFVDLPGRGRTFVREHPGPHGAPTVVLLHGWATTAAMNWSPSFGPLSERFRVIALDHRGHGRGVRAAAPFRLEDCADDVAVLLGELGISQCIAAGYSMGGPIAELLWRRTRASSPGSSCAPPARRSGGTPREWVLSGWPRAAAWWPPHLRCSRCCPRPRPCCGVARAHSGCGTEVFGHDWTRIAEAGREICRFDSCRGSATRSGAHRRLADDADDIVPPHRQLALAPPIPTDTASHGARPRRVHHEPGALRSGPGRRVRRGQRASERRRRRRLTSLRRRWQTSEPWRGPRPRRRPTQGGPTPRSRIAARRLAPNRRRYSDAGPWRALRNTQPENIRIGLETTGRSELADMTHNPAHRTTAQRRARGAPIGISVVPGRDGVGGAVL